MFNKYIFSIIFITLCISGLSAQVSDTTLQQNSAEKLIESGGRLVLGGYGEVHYNQHISADVRSNGKLDVHRMVVLMGYKFNSKTQFITEIEFEHVNEVYVEQAFLQYKIMPELKFRAGLILIPMGLINEYHEPIYYSSVERPLTEKYIIPTTWREIGFGINGVLINSSIKYSLYLVNGINGYDGEAKLSGSSAFRSGRQKGSNSYMSSPSFTGKIDYFGLPNLRLGLSGYLGKTQSTLYNGLDRSDNAAVARADSSSVGINMIGADLRYDKYGFKVKGQYYFGSISNSVAYNQFTMDNNGSSADLGNTLSGYYLELGYNVFQSFENNKTQLFPFFRYESFDTHHGVAEGETKNEAFHRTIFTTGLNWFPSKGSVVKLDVQFLGTGDGDSFEKTLNAGVGVAF